MPQDVKKLPADWYLAASDEDPTREITDFHLTQQPATFKTSLFAEKFGELTTEPSEYITQNHGEPLPIFIEEQKQIRIKKIKLPKLKNNKTLNKLLKMV
jgi:hypothetical protein